MSRFGGVEGGGRDYVGTELKVPDSDPGMEGNEAG